MWKIASPDPVQTGIKVQGLIRLWTPKSKVCPDSGQSSDFTSNPCPTPHWQYTPSCAELVNLLLCRFTYANQS